ncbi:MAG: 3-methyl-2-oxobutanoate hydroxymethyltransferase [Pegethrix bostrychoides GSE-TBD4-15B]|jgi:3-methyl-2-oxobutanoate hydroxymethyltransferase|uniref:3-methyl-2-oxobutanoate hydroxymethyltransferase n=1 Tax=Pegethrix bostrychoides GSE-TBD4-15B TaxID=2839662 RepID=A0A951U6A9_9CYAN|nr:3-methyl-2-oxobutanoate hydroxymethyltransferase [Pegethrix bostrychoides GSE-TBD4-15B]
MAVTTQELIRYKKEGRPIVALTAWDYLIARALDEAGVDLIMVGDSLAMVALGYSTTLPITLDEMIHHAKAVRRGVERALLVVDLPFMSYQESPKQALRSAGRIIKTTGATAVKLEGGYPDMVETVERLVQAGIAVMGHIGLTPQSVHQLGGFRKQGKTAQAAEQILRQAVALQEAGAFSIVLEHIPDDLALKVSQELTIPTVGIGAGPHCDGQVLVTADLLGMSTWRPSFAKAYTNLHETITQAVQSYAEEVKQHQFPKSTS